MDAARRLLLQMGWVCLLAGAAWAAGAEAGTKPPTDAEPAPQPRDCSAPPAPVETAPEDDPVATAMAHYARGRTLMLRGSHALAARELERAAALAPHVGHIWLRLGEAFFDAGNLDRAVEGLDRALEIDPADPEALCLRGRAAQGLDRTEEALRHFEKLLATASPDSAYPILARYYLARLHQQDQNIGGAIEHFAALLDLLEQPSIGFRQHPEVFMLYRRKDQLRQILARLYLLRRDNEKAVGVLRDDVDSLPEDRELLNLLYHAHTRAREHEQARLVARKLISLAPRKATGYQRLIQTYAAEDRPEGAAAELEQIRKEDPENHVAAFHLAAVYESLGRPEEARAIYREFANRPDPLTHADATAAIKLAEIRVREDKPVEAIEMLAQAFTGRPSESSLLIRSARLIDGLENPAEVYEEARRLVDDEETRFGPFLLVGMLAERVRRSEDAIDLYEKAIAREPQAAIAYSRKGDLLIQAGREDDALAVYRQAFESGLELPMFYRKMGMILERLNRLEEALEHYRQAREGAPHDKPTRYLLTSVLLRLGRLDEAEKSLKALLSDFPGDTEAQYQLAGLNLVRGRVEEAEKLVWEALEADPGAIRGKALLAEIRYRQQRFAEAERLASEVLQAEPGSAETRLLMAHAMAQQGDYRDAIGEVRALLAADPENIRYRYILSGLHQQRGDQEAAESELLVILGRNPDHAPANNDLGYLWADRGVNLDRAERMIRAALQVDPERPAYLDSLGWVLYKRQRFEEAVEVLGRATDMAPDLDFVLWDHLGDAYWRMRRRGEATDAWKRAAELLEGRKTGDGEDLRRVREKLKDARSGEPPEVEPVGESPEPDTTRDADAGADAGS